MKPEAKILAAKIFLAMALSASPAMMAPAHATGIPVFDAGNLTWVRRLRCGGNDERDVYVFGTGFSVLETVRENSQSKRFDTLESLSLIHI